jgi:hypothetical protein
VCRVYRKKKVGEEWPIVGFKILFGVDVPSGLGFRKKQKKYL